MERKIKEILNEMSDYLDIEQGKRLQQVLISKLCENQQKKKTATNEEYAKMFLSAKKIEGCSERTIDYYGSIASGTTFAELKIFALKQCKVFDIPMEKQKRFAMFIAQVDKSKFIAYNTLSIQPKLVRGRLQYDQL